MTEPDFDKTVFVIMPFGKKGTDERKENDRVYKSLIKKAVEASRLGLKCVRVDEISRSGNIIDDIYVYLCKAKFVIADLTGRNANVFYELGVRHSVTKHTILLTQSSDDIPFDTKHERTIVYSMNSIEEADDARDNIGRFLREMNRESTGRSPVIEATADASLPATTLQHAAQSGMTIPYLKRIVALRMQQRGYKPKQNGGGQFGSFHLYENNRDILGGAALGFPNEYQHAAVHFDKNDSMSDFKIGLLELIESYRGSPNTYPSLLVVYATCANVLNAEVIRTKLEHLAVSNYGHVVSVDRPSAKKKKLSPLFNHSLMTLFAPPTIRLGIEVIDANKAHAFIDETEVQ